MKKSEQDLVPVLDVEELGIRGGWEGQQLQDSVKAFADLVKRNTRLYMPMSISTTGSWDMPSTAIIFS